MTHSDVMNEDWLTILEIAAHEAEAVKRERREMERIRQ